MSYTTPALDWYYDLDNATGFVSVQRRDDRSNQIPTYVAEPGVEGRIAIEIKASGEDIIVTLNRTFPMSPLSEGMSLTLEGEPIHVKDGETADATLILPGRSIGSEYCYAHGGLAGDDEWVGTGTCLSDVFSR